MNSYEMFDVYRRALRSDEVPSGATVKATLLFLLNEAESTRIWAELTLEESHAVLPKEVNR